MKRKFLIVFLTAFFVAAPVFVYAQKTDSTLEGFEFVDREYNELFYMLSLYSGISISQDDTVQGRATFRLAGEDFEAAFDRFLEADRLFVQKDENSWTVSRIRFVKEERDENPYWIFDANDTKPALIAQKLSRTFGVQISYDMLSENPVSFHAEGKTARDFVLALSRQLGSDYEVQEGVNYFTITKNQTVQNTRSTFSSQGQRTCSVRQNETGTYSLDAQNVPASDLLEKLFSLTGEQFVFADDALPEIKRIFVTDFSFDRIMNFLKSEYGIADVVSDGVHYIFSDAKGGREWKNYSLSFLSPSSAVSLINSRFGKIETFTLSEKKEIICLASPSLHDEIDLFLKTVDVAQKNHTVSLQYISVDELLSHLPPQFNSNSFSKTTQDSVCFFTGTDQEYSLLCESLKNLDCPVKRLRYDVLIIQYQNTEDFSWQNMLSANRLTLGDRNDASAILGSVLGFNLNVVSAFGLDFAASLQTALNENNASVFADTTLYGVSGQKISFKNTNTYRYRDNNVDPETGKPIYTGITREIVSGLHLDVTGWISGDGMITTSITASVSRQGADLSSKTGNPPPTSEKTITTQVRGNSGEPIVLTGLIQDEENSSSQGVPLLSKIPALGFLFKDKSTTKEHTEMIIYLVPHWETDEKTSDKIEEEFSVENLVKKFVFGEE